MCDIVNSPCKVCGKDLPLHLGDYDTAPSEVECYCADHLPEKDVRMFTLTEDSLPYDSGMTPEFLKGWKMGIRSLTQNAHENEDKNYPNVAADWEEICR